MNKKIASIAAALALLTASTGAGAQGSLVNSAPSMNLSPIKDRDAFVYASETGAWSYLPDRAQAALDAVANDYVRGYTGAGTLMFNVSLEGNALSNTCMPVLNMYLIGSAEIGAQAASMLVNGVRYDFEVTSEVIDIEGYRAELMRAPLNADGIAMLRALNGAEEYGVMLHGLKKSYSAAIKLDGDYDTAREKLQAASADCCLQALDVCDALGAGAGAQDMIGEWERANAMTCAYATVELAAQPTVELGLDENFALLSTGDSSEDVRSLQQLLCDSGYMFVNPTSRYNQHTRSAVLRAQKALGFVPTGSADAALIAALESGVDADDLVESEPDADVASVEAGDTEAEAGVLYEIADVARVSIDAYRFAGSVKPSAGAAEAALTVSDRDNTLLLFEGELTSLAAAEVDVSWDYTAVATLDGRYSYECTMYVEQDAGAKFGSTLLPLGGGRLIVAAEIPAAAAQHAGEWTLTLTFGDAVLTYTAEADGTGFAGLPE